MEIIGPKSAQNSAAHFGGLNIFHHGLTKYLIVTHNFKILFSCDVVTLPLYI